MLCPFFLFANIKGKNLLKKKSQDFIPSEKRPDIDTEITNKRLRADSGSKSKLSIKTFFSYTGGSIKSPLANERPLLKSSSTTRLRPALSGSVGLSYRFDIHNSLAASFGMSVVSPFHDSLDTLRQRLEVDNPSLTYSRVYRWRRWQNISSISVIWPTTDYSKLANQQSILSMGQTALTTLESLPLSIGAVVYGYYISHSDGPLPSDVPQNRRGRFDYSFSFYPFLEYALSDKYHLSTTFGWWSFNHYRKSNPWVLTQSESYQTLELGISIDRDFYLVPNIQFNPSDIRDDKTNVGLNIYMNVF
ncbi:MAG: hypothetical protein D6797_01735 [Bdellovibrio sp.]|nr:MAG: hypothetical protein D6797_01735 [Bdellovibrio sp.]